MPRISAIYGFRSESEVNPRRLFMPSRLRVFSTVCIFAALVSVQVLAQSNSASFSGHGARAPKRTSRLPNGLQTPTFASAVSYFSGENGADAVAMADVNGDGKPDLVVTNWCASASCTVPGNNIGVLLGNGDGTFQPAVTYPSLGLYADAIAVADVNGDGNPDLVVANCGSSFSQNNCVSTSGSGDLAVLLGNGDGTFKAAVPYSLGASGATSVAVADVNGDGKLDLIVATGSNTAGLVGVLLGMGDGTFQAEVTYSSGGLSPLALAVADVNGDGEPDVVVANRWTDNTYTNSNVAVLLNGGTGNFPSGIQYGTGGFYPDSVAIADVNGDGNPDLVVANSSSIRSTGGLGNVGVLLGNGKGAFQAAMAYSSGLYGATSVAVADVNGDGKLDLVVANCSSSGGGCSGGGGNVGVLLGNGDGTFQTALPFGPGGNTPFEVAVGDVNGDGRPDLVVASCASNACGAAAGTLGVLLNTTTPWLVYASLGQQVDYFGEGKADFTVWRPSTATWYIAGSGQQLIKRWGSSTDVPVIGDYDGDGKTDIAVWRPSNGTWYIIEPDANQIAVRPFGVQGDVPVPGDYDGDGKTDIAVWRPSNGVWYITQSSNGQVVEVQWGQPGDVPVPGDYDGDGKTDIAVWRPSNGTWYIIEKGANKIVTLQWGMQGDMPVPADYDGDGKTDIAVWRPSTGTWYVIEPGANKIVTVQWGSAGDVPVARDYDGDLKADFAVWRPSNGVWYVVQSSNNQVVEVQWGQSGDIPLNKPVGQ
jgi:hypothetical protein